MVAGTGRIFRQPLKRQNGGPHIVNSLNLILDVHQMGLVPMNIASGLRRMRNTDQSFRGGGINVIVGADYYLKLLWQFMSPDFPPQWTLHFVETYDDALRLIKDARAVVERV